MKKKIKLTKKDKQILREWFEENPNQIAHNMLQSLMINGKWPKMEINESKNSGGIHTSDPRDRSFIGIKYNHDMMRQVIDGDIKKTIKNAIKESLLHDEHSIGKESNTDQWLIKSHLVKTCDEDDDPNVEYVQVPDPFGEDTSDYYVKYTFKNQQVKELFHSNNKYAGNIKKENFTYDKIDKLTFGRRNYRPKSTLSQPKNNNINNAYDGDNAQMPFQNNNFTPGFMQAPVPSPFQQNQVVLEPITGDHGTIQEAITKIGRDNFFKGNRELDDIDIRYNDPRTRTFPFISKEGESFAKLSNKKEGGAFPIIRDMLKIVLGKDFDNVGYDKKTNEILLPASAFDQPAEGNCDYTTYTSDSHYKDYIAQVLDQIQHSQLQPSNKKDVIFLAINRIKADYQAANWYYNKVEPEGDLLKYAQFIGPQDSIDDTLGIRFKKHDGYHLNQLFFTENNRYDDTAAVSYNTAEICKKKELTKDPLSDDLEENHFLSTYNIDKVPYYKNGLLNKNNWRINYKSLFSANGQSSDIMNITKNQLRVYRNAAKLAALHGKAFPSGHFTQDRKYLLHGHIFTVAQINGKTNWKEQFDLSQHQKKQAENHKNDNPFFEATKKIISNGSRTNIISNGSWTNNVNIRTLRNNQKIPKEESRKQLLRFAFFDVPLKRESALQAGEFQTWCGNINLYRFGNIYNETDYKHYAYHDNQNTWAKQAIKAGLYSQWNDDKASLHDANALENTLTKISKIVQKRYDAKQGVIIDNNRSDKTLLEERINKIIDDNEIYEVTQGAVQDIAGQNTLQTINSQYLINNNNRLNYNTSYRAAYSATNNNVFQSIVPTNRQIAQQLQIPQQQQQQYSIAPIKQPQIYSQQKFYHSAKPGFQGIITSTVIPVSAYYNVNNLSARNVLKYKIPNAQNSGFNGVNNLNNVNSSNVDGQPQLGYGIQLANSNAQSGNNVNGINNNNTQIITQQNNIVNEAAQNNGSNLQNTTNNLQNTNNGTGSVPSQSTNQTINLQAQTGDDQKQPLDDSAPDRTDFYTLTNIFWLMSLAFYSLKNKNVHDCIRILNESIAATSKYMETHKDFNIPNNNPKLKVLENVVKSYSYIVKQLQQDEKTAALQSDIGSLQTKLFKASNEHSDSISMYNLLNKFETINFQMANVLNQVNETDKCEKFFINAASQINSINNLLDDGTFYKEKDNLFYHDSNDSIFCSAPTVKLSNQIFTLHNNNTQQYAFTEQKDDKCKMPVFLKQPDGSNQYIIRFENVGHEYYIHGSNQHIILWCEHNGRFTPLDFDTNKKDKNGCIGTIVYDTKTGAVTFEQPAQQQDINNAGQPQNLTEINNISNQATLPNNP